MFRKRKSLFSTAQTVCYNANLYRKLHLLKHSDAFNYKTTEVRRKTTERDVYAVKQHFFYRT